MLNPIEAKVYVEVILEQLDMLGVTLEGKYTDKLMECIDTTLLIELERKIVHHVYYKNSDTDIKTLVENYIAANVRQ